MVRGSWHLGFENILKLIDLETDFDNFCILILTRKNSDSNLEKSILIGIHSAKFLNKDGKGSLFAVHGQRDCLQCK
jgi:hypothetical protein